MAKIRLQRFMADCGVAARRECEEMVLAGRVKVNDLLVRELPVFIDPLRDMIAVDDEPLEPETPEGQEKVYYLLNKPKGILVTNYDPSDRKTVGELMKGINERVFPIGRLDMDSRGLLIMTNDGDLANRLTHPRYGVEKTYIVEVEGRLAPEEVERVKRGMYLGPEPGKIVGDRGGLRTPVARTERFHVKILGRERGRTVLEVRLSESRNREIRRVMARIGHPVRDLNRVALGEKITIRNLAVGAFRKLSPQEIQWLYDASSKELHDKERAQTQQWYEQKEMDKERKRIKEETVAIAKAAAAKPRGVMDGRRETNKAIREKDRRERPVKKGKKPFVPPSGRNAGKMLGGNKLGKKNLERERLREETPEDIRELPSLEPPHASPQVAHPLGDLARDEE